MTHLVSAINDKKRKLCEIHYSHFENVCENTESNQVFDIKSVPYQNGALWFLIDAYRITFYVSRTAAHKTIDDYSKNGIPGEV